MASMHERLKEYLDAIDRDACYRVDAVLKVSPHEMTERVFFVGANGAEQGPFIRKRLDVDCGLGSAYRRLWESQRAGRRFLHVPHMIECYTTDASFVVVMECVRGLTLADAVWQADPSLELASRVFEPICNAVIELHESFDPPMIHRDLKPSNIMLSGMDGAGDVYATVIDFGIAREYDSSALNDTHNFGTRGYSPPEQFGYGQTDVRSDVYSLGLILYYCLTENTPDAAIVRKGFKGLGLDMPEGLRAVLVRATAFDPEARFSSVRELREAFKAALGRPAPEVCPPPDAAERFPGPPPHVPEGVTSHSRPSLGILPRVHVPEWIGVCWNTMLAFIWVLFMAVTTSMILEPSTSLVEFAPWGRWVMGYGVSGISLGIFLFALSDKRPLIARIPLFAGFAHQNPVIRFIVLAVIAFAVALLSAIIANLSI